MDPTAAPTVVFTDLDGTLLSHDTYRPEEAEPVVRQLQRRGIPVVFCSSKTTAEQIPLRRELGLDAHPFIVENGSAIIAPNASGLAGADWEPSQWVPDARVKVLGLRLADILQKLEQARRLTGEPLRGYQQMTVREVAEVTGLTEDAAVRARSRGFSETIVDQMDEARWARVLAAFDEVGLTCVHGGRFHTVTGDGAHKGEAVRLVTRRYTAAYGREIQTMALGDSANDAAMLAAVDQAYLMERPDHTWADLPAEHLHRVTGVGPAGWVQAIRSWWPGLVAAGSS